MTMRARNGMELGRKHAGRKLKKRTRWIGKETGWVNGA